MRRVSAGRVGRAHGRDGAFYVEGPDGELAEGTSVELAGSNRRVVSRAGTGDRPLIRVSGIGDRESAAALRGESLLIEEELGPGEWLAGDLVGCEVVGLGRVARVLAAPSCDLLELADGTLVPLVADAVRDVDLAARRIDVDLDFLGAR